MASQITVRIPDRLRKALEEAARRTQRKASEVVRMALSDYLRIESPSGKRSATRVRRLVGSLASDIPDLAERHREYVLESLRRGR
ncbi:MAG: ribbon-helix-helix protein, CopG family [Planctomycetota bacterium]